jgi:Putative MetA-pathway of phenol degradation
MQKQWVTGCAFAFGLGAASFCLAADNEVSAGAGINYSAGKYGTGSETRIWSVPLLARYDTDKWTFKLSVPFLRVTGPSNVIPGIGRTDDRGREARRGAGTTTVSGLGDVTASAIYNLFWDENARRGLDLTGRVKLPTADKDKGLGTGSTDESVQVDVYQTIERTTVFADVGYTHFGHSDVVQLDNALNYGIGASQKLTSIDSLGASLDGRQRVTPGGGPQRELTLFWNRKTEDHTRFQAYVLFGFANGSPDRGFGVSLLRAF